MSASIPMNRHYIFSTIGQISHCIDIQYFFPSFFLTTTYHPCCRSLLYRLYSIPYFYTLSDAQVPALHKPCNQFQTLVPKNKKLTSRRATTSQQISSYKHYKTSTTTSNLTGTLYQHCGMLNWIFLQI